jgi:hypothetical protein
VGEQGAAEGRRESAKSRHLVRAGGELAGDGTGVDQAELPPASNHAEAFVQFVRRQDTHRENYPDWIRLKTGVGGKSIESRADVSRDRQLGVSARLAAHGSMQGLRVMTLALLELPKRRAALPPFR